jgi:ABC-type phosphate/phosphonate transport system substrate-binding protein
MQPISEAVPWAAALPMYDLAELKPATDRFWQALRDRLDHSGIADLPQILSRPDKLMEFWRQPNLLLSQTCGYPLITELRDAVQLVATPVYSAPGCESAHYRSVIVVRASAKFRNLAELRGAVCAINTTDSHSGMNILRAELAPFAPPAPFFADIRVTGGHLASLATIQKGEADVAAIDCVTFALLARVRPGAVAGLRILAWTQAAPALPLITSRHTPVRVLYEIRRALDTVMADPVLQTIRQTLLLKRFEVLTWRDYATIIALEQAAIARGYPVLR